MSKSVFITGASSGLGRQLASEFASRGYGLALAARQIDVLHTIKSELEERHGVLVLVYPLDVGDAEQVRDTLNTASAELGKLDIVVANAGLGSDVRTVSHCSGSASPHSQTSAPYRPPYGLTVLCNGL